MTFIPEAHDVAKATGYAGLGAIVLKFAQWFARLINARRRLGVEETKVLLDAQAEFREELRKAYEQRRLENEDLRRRIDELEERLALVENELRGERRRAEELEKENARLKASEAELHLELRALKKALARISDEPHAPTGDPRDY
jgi:chromosome segregation ATPase